MFGAVTVVGGQPVSINIALVVISKISLFVMLILTIISGVDYLVKNINILFDEKTK